MDFWTVGMVLAFLMAGAMVAFAFTFPDVMMSRARERMLVGVGLLVLAGTALVLFFPAWWFTETGPMIRPLNVGQPVALLVLGYRWFRSRPGAYRNQLLWGLLPFAFWNVHDVLGFYLLPAVIGPRNGFLWWFSSPGFAFNVAAGLIGFTIALCLFAWCIARRLRGRASADERFVALFTPYLFALSLVQVFGPGFGVPNAFAHVHILLDYLAIAIIVYGVWRHNVVDLDVRLKWGVKRGTLVAVFVAVFFVSAQVGQAFLTTEYGWAIGGVIAGLLLLAINPLQRLTARLADVALPGVEDTSSYLDRRRNEVYRAALEEILSDGQVSLKERRVLLGLQDSLGLDGDAANRIERAVLDALTGGEKQ